MSPARHRQSAPRRTVRQQLRLALPVTAATLVTGVVVGVAVSQETPAPEAAAARIAPVKVEVAGGDGSPFLVDRAERVSRSAKRVTIREMPDVVDREYRTADLNLWPTPKEKGKPIAVLDEGGRVAVTGVERNGFAQIVSGDQVRWVTAKYLAEKKPTAARAAGVSSRPCPTSAGIESGITPNAVRVFRTVCAAFPEVTSYGGWRGDGEHVDGHAIDIMVSGATGQRIADYLRANAGTLKVDNIIWSQQIWTTQRSSEGWRGMEDRGSTTANHFDHVHVRVF